MYVQCLRSRKHKLGFTLVEIIVVLVVLAVLAALLVPSMVKWIEKAEERKLTVPTRACVVAAQTLATEAYAKWKAGGAGGAFSYLPTDEDIRALADITEGAVTEVSIYPGTTTLNSLTYKDANNKRCTYVNTAGETYFMFGGTEAWATGNSYEVGSVIQAGGYIFRCIRTHTSGDATNTRNPAVKSNKTTWEVVAYVDKPLSYTSSVRYAEGVQVTYDGSIYVRTDYNLTAGQTPYSKSDSRFWLYVGPAATTP